MAITRVKVWVAGETLTALDLNTEFDNVVAGVNITAVDDKTVVATGGAVARRLDGRFLEGDRTVTIPGDYATLQAAVDGESFWSRADGVRINIQIQTGHSLTDGLFIDGGDYGHFRIQSIDAEVPLAGSWPINTNVIEGKNCRMPVLDCLISGGGSFGQHGYVCTNNSEGRVTPGSGIRNLGEADSVGLRISDGSSCDAEDCIFNDSHINVEVLAASQLSANLLTTGADFSGASGPYCAKFDSGSGGAIKNADMSGYTGTGEALRVAESNVDADNIDCSGATAGSATFIAAGSAVNLTNSDLSGAVAAGKNALRVSESTVLAANVNCNDAGGTAIFIDDASNVDLGAAATANDAGSHGLHVLASHVVAGNITITDATDDAILVDEAAVVNAVNAVISGPGGNGIHATGASTINAKGASINLAGTDGVLADEVSTVNLNAGSVTNSTSEGVFAFGGSHINVIGATVTGNGGLGDLVVQKGSYMAADDCVTTNSPPNPDIVDCSVSAFNETNGSQGIIWQT